MASRSKAFVVLVAAALCAAAMRTLAFVGASAESPGDSEDSDAGSFVSPMFMAKLMTGWSSLNFAIAYIFTEQTIPGYFKEPPNKAGSGWKLTAYFSKTIGQNQMPLLLMSVISVASGIVSKEYMLTITLHHLFLACDVVRMSTICEAVGFDKTKLYPYMPITLVFAGLSYTTWKAMPATPLDDSDGSAGSLVSAMFMAKLFAAWWGLHFAIAYIFTEQAIPGYFKERPQGKEWDLAVYLCKCCGQNQMPLLLMSVLSVASGAVSKEYMLMLTLLCVFLTGDMVRMMTTCEAVGMDKSKIYPYMAIFIGLMGLSYTTWKAM